MTRNKSNPILSKAGNDIISAKSNVRIPFAPRISRKIRPIRASRMMRKSVGCTKYCLMNSDRVEPMMERMTTTKSKQFHGLRK